MLSIHSPGPTNSRIYCLQRPCKHNKDYQKKKNILLKKTRSNLQPRIKSPLRWTLLASKIGGGSTSIPSPSSASTNPSLIFPSSCPSRPANAVACPTITNPQNQQDEWAKPKLEFPPRKDEHTSVHWNTPLRPGSAIQTPWSATPISKPWKSTRIIKQRSDQRREVGDLAVRMETTEYKP